jgi:hypothetical protein
VKTLLAPDDSRDAWMNQPQPAYVDDPDNDPYVRALHLAVWIIGEDATEDALNAAWRDREARISAGELDRSEWRARVIGWDNGDEGAVGYSGVWLGLRSEDDRVHVALREVSEHGNTIVSVPLADINDVAVYVRKDTV